MQPRKPVTNKTTPITHLTRALLSIAFLLLLSSQATANTTTIEDAVSGTTTAWALNDKTPAGATITNVYDNTLNSNVTALAGSGTSNSFRLGSTTASTGFNIQANDLASWRIKTDQAFVFYIATTTSNGFRFLVYRSIDNSRGLVNNRYVFTGIGRDTLDGQWHTISRNLQADLNAAEPGNQIMSINGFQARGVMSLDDITFYSEEDEELEPTAPPTPELITPLANASLETNSTARFTWASADHASQYQFQVIDTANATLDAEV